MLQVIMDETAKCMYFFTAHKCSSLVPCYYESNAATQSRYVTGTSWNFRKQACSVAESGSKYEASSLNFLTKNSRAHIKA